MDRSFFTDNPVFSTLQKADLTNVVGKMIEDSDVIKALRGFKEEGLEVSINDIRKSFVDSSYTPSLTYCSIVR